MTQSWRDLLFAHWPVEPSALRSLLPASLRDCLDVRDGLAWVGIVPFRMSNIRAHFLPPIPGLTALPELNVRTYLTVGGKPGVWFFSLDADHALVVHGARRLFHLNYQHARMRCVEKEGWILYESVRRTSSASRAPFRGRYRPVGDPHRAKLGSLDHWLTERYCLYVVDDQGEVWRGEINHLPWTLQPAEAELEPRPIALSNGIDLPEQAPLCHFSRRIDARVWMLDRVTF